MIFIFSHTILSPTKCRNARIISPLKRRNSSLFFTDHCWRRRAPEIVYFFVLQMKKPKHRHVKDPAPSRTVSVRTWIVCCITSGHHLNGNSSAWRSSRKRKRKHHWMCRPKNVSEWAGESRNPTPCPLPYWFLRASAVPTGTFASLHHGPM